MSIGKEPSLNADEQELWLWREKMAYGLSPNATAEELKEAKKRNTEIQKEEREKRRKEKPEREQKKEEKKQEIQQKRKEEWRKYQDFLEELKLDKNVSDNTIENAILEKLHRTDEERAFMLLRMKKWISVFGGKRFFLNKIKSNNSEEAGYFKLQSTRELMTRKGAEEMSEEEFRLFYGREENEVDDILDAIFSAKENIKEINEFCYFSEKGLPEDLTLDNLLNTENVEKRKKWALSLELNRNASLIEILKGREKKEAKNYVGIH